MTTSVPFRQIRAQSTETTITVYQAYNSEIASAAVAEQKLNASPKFSTTRMTWIKPSWAWMLYRSGYSYKDPGQERVLALTMTKDAFFNLLRQSITAQSHGRQDDIVATQSESNTGAKSARVRVQWDPERTVRLEKLDYRSIQIGVPGALVHELAGGTVKIEDVTDRARKLKRVLEEDPDVSTTSLISMDLIPEENVVDVDKELRALLRMEEVELVESNH